MSTIRNSVLLVGRPTKPVMNSEEKQASFKIVVTNDFNSGCQTNNTFDCVAHGEKASRVVRSVQEGNLLAIDGVLRNYDYQDRLGDTHTHTEIEVSDFFLIEKTKEGKQ